MSEEAEVVINQNEEQYKNLHFRMYENKYPKENELVYAKVVDIIDNSAYVSLQEYDSIQGMLYSDEVSVGKCKNIKQFISIGKDEVLTVLRVDLKRGFIDLSKKRVRPFESKECKIKFGKSKTVENIVKILSVHTSKTMEYLYKNIFWPLYKKYEHAYDGLKLILNGDDSIFDGFKIADNIKNELIQIIKKRLTPEPVKIRSLFELTCFSFEGIDAIKQSLLNGEKKGTESVPIKFRYIRSPLYECSVNIINKKEGIKIMNLALKEVKKSIEAKRGNFCLKVEPEIVGEKSIKMQIKEFNDKSEEEETEEDKDIDFEEEGIKPDVFTNNCNYIYK